jgi:hypothetical protein
VEPASPAGANALMADKPASPDEIHLLAEVLDSEGVPYAFIGGVAMGVWGVPRTTFDLDVAVPDSEADLSRVLAAMSTQGWVVDPIIERGFRDRLAGMDKIQVQLPVQSTLLTADIFLGTTRFLRSVIDRRLPIDLGHGPISVCTPADLILLKLIAGRRKDQLDVENILAVQGIPEREYLERWAAELGVRDRLDAILAGGGSTGRRAGEVGSALSARL